MLQCVPSIPSLVRVLIMNGCCTLSNDATDKGLISEIDKQFIQLNSKKKKKKKQKKKKIKNRKKTKKKKKKKKTKKKINKKKRFPLWHSGNFHLPTMRPKKKKKKNKKPSGI